MQQPRDEGRGGGGTPITQKMRLSCDNCKLSKIRCGQERPACRRCRSHDLTCCYSPSRRMGRPRSSKPKQQEQPRPQIDDSNKDRPSETQHTSCASEAATETVALDGPIGGNEPLLPLNHLGTSSDGTTNDAISSPPADSLTAMSSAAFSAFTFTPEDDSLYWGGGVVDDVMIDTGCSAPMFPTVALPDVAGLSVPTHMPSFENLCGSIIPSSSSSASFAAITSDIDADKCACAGDLVTQTSQAISGLRQDGMALSLGHILSWVERLSERLSVVLGCASCSTHLSTALAAWQAIHVATNALLGQLKDPDGGDGRHQPRLQLGNYLVKLEEGEEFARHLVQRRLGRLRDDIDRLKRAKDGTGMRDDPCSAIWTAILDELRARQEVVLTPRR